MDRMHWIDWTIIAATLVIVTATALLAKRYTRTVSDFLAAGRCLRRYLLGISSGAAAFGAISFMAYFEGYFNGGFPGTFWEMVGIPLMAIIWITGFVTYRFRETRAMTLAQFFEMRYSRGFRVLAGIICFVAGVVNFGIFPKVGAWFFIHYCQLPTEFACCGYMLETFPVLMIALLGVSLFFVFLGGQIAITLTDFVQGIIINGALLALLVFVLCYFNWETVSDTLIAKSTEGKSLINPFDGNKLDGFNFSFFVIMTITTIYMCGSWQGEQGYRCSATNAHEARMGGILFDWGRHTIMLVLLLLPVGVYVILNSLDPIHQQVANEVGQRLQNANEMNMLSQMRVPIVLSHILPIGMVGLFGAMILCAFISTHDTYLHSWGSVFVQDVVLPFRKKPLTTRCHLWLLRGGVTLVAVLIFCFSYYVPANDYIMMFFQLSAAIFTGGAGICIIGGLYWKYGTTKGAYAALITGTVIAVGGILLQIFWCVKSDGGDWGIYYWFTADPDRLSWLESMLATLDFPGANLIQNLTTNPTRCPLAGNWLQLVSIGAAVTAYFISPILQKLSGKLQPYNLDKMLHRGEYGVQGDHLAKPATGLKTLIPSAEFSRADRVIYWAKLAWTGLFCVLFLVILALYLGWRDVLSQNFWLAFWKYRLVFYVFCAFGFTLWFVTGSIFDIRFMIRKLRAARTEDDIHDTGIVTHNEDGEA